MAPRLSHHKHGAGIRLMPCSLSKDWTHIISVIAFAKALYSAYVLDLDTVVCFLAHQDIRFGPKKIANPPVDRLSSRHPAQSESEKALTRVDGDLLKVRPVFRVFLIYLTMRLAAVQ